MKKFQFPLDTVLDYRRQVQDSLQVELGTFTAEVHRQEEILAAARQRYSEINQEYREKKAEGMWIAEVRGFETALEVQETVIAKETTKLKKIQRQMEAKRRELVSAKQDASSVEKLREKKFHAYTKDLEKSEEKFIDDLVCAGRGNARNAFL
ncbi:flagellar export protein FliJ [Oscillibacter valericigenes Sjm18-20]|nr:flagellar export protein FliJ [Oscillibacter valericigenes Sjm18-20]